MAATTREAPSPAPISSIGAVRAVSVYGAHGAWGTPAVFVWAAGTAFALFPVIKKTIIAYIQPYLLNEVKQELFKGEITKMSVTNNSRNRVTGRRSRSVSCH